MHRAPRLHARFGPRPIACLPALIAAWLAPAACAQTIMDPAKLGDLIPKIESQQADGLRCEPLFAGSSSFT